MHNVFFFKFQNLFFWSFEFVYAEISCLSSDPSVVERTLHFKCFLLSDNNKQRICSFNLYNQTNNLRSYCDAKSFMAKFDFVSKENELGTSSPGQYFLHFQNAGRQGATRETILGVHSLTQYSVQIHLRISTDVYH